MQRELIAESTDRHREMVETISYLSACIAALILATAFSFGVLHKTGKVFSVDLQRRINPNDAPVVSLERLPQIGMSRAEKIIAYREAAADKPAFSCPEDLQKVKGIGPAIAGQLAEYLRFE